MKYYISIFLMSIIVCSVCVQCDTIMSPEINKSVETVPDSLYPSSELIISTHGEWAKTHYPERIQEFKEKPLEVNDIVFLGNSITEQGGDWGARFHNPKIRNRGIAGDTTEGILARLEEIFYFKSTKVFLLIGINDLFREDISSEYVYQNIRSVVRNIYENSPNTKIFVQTVLPTITERLIDKIAKVNALLLEAENSEAYQLIDLHTVFAVEGDMMNMKYSTDGVHLNKDGYSLWENLLLTFLK